MVGLALLSAEPGLLVVLYLVFASVVLAILVVIDAVELASSPSSGETEGVVVGLGPRVDVAGGRACVVEVSATGGGPAKVVPFAIRTATETLGIVLPPGGGGIRLSPRSVRPVRGVQCLRPILGLPRRSRSFGRDDRAVRICDGDRIAVWSALQSADEPIDCGESAAMGPMRLDAYRSSGLRWYSAVPVEDDERSRYVVLGTGTRAEQMLESKIRFGWLWHGRFVAATVAPVLGWESARWVAATWRESPLGTTAWMAVGVALLGLVAAAVARRLRADVATLSASDPGGLEAVLDREDAVEEPLARSVDGRTVIPGGSAGWRGMAGSVFWLLLLAAAAVAAAARAWMR